MRPKAKGAPAGSIGTKAEARSPPSRSACPHPLQMSQHRRLVNNYIQLFKNCLHPCSTPYAAQVRASLPKVFQVFSRMATSYGKGPSTTHGPSLTSAACRAALRDPTHLFRAMWAARRDSSEQSPQCWDVPRRHTNETGPPGALDGFDERVLSGSACRRGRLDENWYHTVGKPHVRLVRDTMYTPRQARVYGASLGPARL